MMIGPLITMMYWAIFTIRRGFNPKVKQQIKANAFDKKGTDVEAKEKAEKMYYPLKVTEWALGILGWVETLLLVLLIIWAIYVIGVIMTQGVVLL